MDSMCAKLEGLGFSPYEAKAYCALLAKCPATGYEVARQAGIPSSKIYETLERLVGKGAATTVEGDAVMYMPVPVHALASQLKREAAIMAEALEREVAEYRSPRDNLFWNLTGLTALLARASEIIGSAERNILLLGWVPDLTPLEDELVRARNRGVEIAGIAYGEGRLKGLQLLRKSGRRGGQWRRERFFMLSADGRVAVVATLGRFVTGCWSANAAMGFQMSDYLRLQIDRQTGKFTKMRQVLPRFSRSARVKAEHPELAQKGFKFKRRTAGDEDIEA